MSADRYNQSEYVWYLQLKNKGLERRLESFETGSAYVNLRCEYERVIRNRNSSIQKLKKDLASARAQIVTNRNRWFEVMEDVEKEHVRALAEKDRTIEDLKKRVIEVERQRDALSDQLRDLRKEYYRIGEELEAAQGLNRKLTAQVNRDFQNSSLPSSSQGPARKVIPNSREKTDRKRGGQPGHKGHRLTRQPATQTILLPDPEEYVNHPDYYKTNDTVSRQKIVLTVDAVVMEYRAAVFRNRKTGSRVHAAFPAGCETDISYDSSVKAFAFLLAAEGNMAAGKIRSVLQEVSGGKINLSEAFINGLVKEFSQKSTPEKQTIIQELMMSPVMNADFTNANVNGKGKQVLILASPEKADSLFIARDHKGHKGILGTPAENYVGTLVHDHDRTFYHYGMQHQECMQHTIRYLIGSTQNEPERKWNGQMLKLVREMLHYRNHLDGEPDPKIVEEFKKRYDRILDLAREEYENEPPGDYYRDGYNLYRRLVEYRESELLFLHDRTVPANNSLAERLARIFKRKQKQMIVLRSDDNFIYLCDSLSVITTFRNQDGTDLYRKSCEIFSREKERKPRYIPGMAKEAGVTSQ